MDKQPTHRFGGEWTKKKLRILKDYLEVYSTALRDKFELTYIDAFAGSRYRVMSQSRTPTDGQLPLFEHDAELDEVLTGSAAQALEVVPGFQKFVFIEKDRGRAQTLVGLQDDYPSKMISVLTGDANTMLRDICADFGKNRGRRAVLFMDPYGMEVEWETLKAVADTQAIDMWLLVPFGQGLLRVLKNKGDLPPGWARRLDLFFGATDWRTELYKPAKQADLFEEDVRERRPAEAVAEYLRKRLNSIFTYVLETAPALYNSTGSPLYLFCFACGNRSEKARKLAMKLARAIAKGP